MNVYRAYVLVYDIADPKRLRRVARLAEQNGTRFQKSVFICRLTDAQKKALKAALLRQIDEEADAVSFIPLCVRCEGGAEHLAKAAPLQVLPDFLFA